MDDETPHAGGLAALLLADGIALPAAALAAAEQEFERLRPAIDEVRRAAGPGADA